MIVGAGLAGLVAARALVDSGAGVLLLERSGGPGGRLATRRLGGATLDHGAQFFTVRSDQFAALVDRWRDLGAGIITWSEGFAQASDLRGGPDAVTDTGGDGHPRFVVRNGMNALATVLGRDLEIRSAVHVSAVRPEAGGWLVDIDRATDRPVHGRALLCTPPVPQTLALFPDTTALPSQLQDVTFDPCLALLVVLDRDPVLPEPGGIQFAGGPVRWLSDNARKPVSQRPALTVHATTDWSRAFFDADAEQIRTPLLVWLKPWMGRAQVVATHLTRWRYAQPATTVDERTLLATVGASPAAFAGDAFGHPRVEGAARSGLAAADLLRAALG